MYNDTEDKIKRAGGTALATIIGRHGESGRMAGMEEIMFREMRRKKQQLPEDECRKVLAAGRRGNLAVSGDDGYPYSVPLNYYYDEESGNIYFHGAADGHKMDSIRRNDKVSFNVLSDGWKNDGDWWLQFNSVTVFGTIRVVEDAALKEKALRAIGMKYYSDVETTEKAVKNHLNHVCILEIRPDHMTGKHINEK